MPVIRVDGPKMDDLDRKRQMVKAFALAASEAYGMDKEHIVVLIREISPENVGIGGKLIVDRRTE
jgi:4-oxalocrotonate tautomerase